ncbi:MAG: hypothetical protein EXR71_13040 [Myxococcales bacterium]|nr:hypothetical protein [Myxococcales bacterium]
MRTAALLMVLAWGCGESLDAPTAKPPTKKSAPAPRIAADDGAEEWFYNPAGKRDPFSSFLAKQRGPDEISPDAPPLQRWETDRFLLTGVIWNIDAPRALVIDPEGIGHVVRHGTYVGRNWGKVTAISEDGIVVTEEYRMLDGELVVNPVTVRFGGAVKK